jgi:hypothetical protein
MKQLSILILLTLVAGCAETKTSQWKSDPEYRAYISTRLADAIIEYDILNDEVVVEERCDGSGWITQGDGHRTECPGCDACESTGDAPKIEWSTDTVLDAPQILEEFEIPIEKEVEPEPEVSQQPVKQKTKRGLFGRRK